MRLVIDTNVLVAALRSKQGVSNKLLCQIFLKKIEVSVSVAVLLEYEEVLKRSKMVPIPPHDVQKFLDALCIFSRHQEIFYRWRPSLSDPKDEMFLELAVASEATHIITYNTRDFSLASKFGIKVLLPSNLLKEIKHVSS